MANTHKTIERVPDDKFAWKPHDKSFAMGALATHLSNIPSWAGVTINMDEFDMSPGGVPMKTPAVNSTAEVLTQFDKNVAEARAAIAGASDEHLFGLWTLLPTGTRLWPCPVSPVWQLVMNHISSSRSTRRLPATERHSGALVYGPSADEAIRTC
jgi:hypothetical protein